jgi:hypothetical protein
MGEVKEMRKNGSEQRIIANPYTGSSKKINGIWNSYNLKNTGQIYTFGILKCSEKFKGLGLP